jgi:hypothetical protein
MSATSLRSGSAVDVFNGDADGICALHQLRLAEPKEALLVTGVKRDVGLLQRVPQEAGEVTVLDVSFDANAAVVPSLLEAGARITWFDHHSAKYAFAHSRLQMHWDEAPEVCTSILVDRHLQGRFRPWAITAAFGDNMPQAARTLAAGLDMDERRMRALEELGTLLNYNAYGERVEDLHVPPDLLYGALHAYVDPMHFIEASPYYRLLAEGYRDDACRIDGLAPYAQSAAGAVYVLPDAPWARRISGLFANRLSAAGDTRSCAVVTQRSDGGYVISVRAGQPALRSANGLCERFATGGGRKAAAGINHLPAAELDRFIAAFCDYFSMSGPANAGGAARASGS